MGTKRINMYWHFSPDLFSQMLQEKVKPDDYVLLAEIVGVSDATVRVWARGSGGNYRQPSMHNLLKVCNFFDVDPRNFFEVRETPYNED